GFPRRQLQLDVTRNLLLARGHFPVLSLPVSGVSRSSEPTPRASPSGRDPSMSSASALLDVVEVQLDRRGPPEDADHDLQLLLVRPDFLHRSREIRERADHDPDLVPFLELLLRLGFDGAFRDALAEILDVRRLHLSRPLVPD